MEIVLHAVSHCHDTENHVPNSCRRSVSASIRVEDQHTSRGGVLPKVSCLISAQQSTRCSLGRGTLGEFLIELCYPRHADGIFGSSESLQRCQIWRRLVIFRVAVGKREYRWTGFAESGRVWEGPLSCPRVEIGDLSLPRGLRPSHRMLATYKAVCQNWNYLGRNESRHSSADDERHLELVATVNEWSATLDLFRLTYEKMRGPF